MSCGYCGAEYEPFLLADEPKFGWKKRTLKHKDNCLGLSKDDCDTQYVLERPSWTEIFIDFAHALSQRSSCRRLQVGCVVVSSDCQRILSMGYNGNAAGLHNDCDTNEPGRCGCIHSEINAIAKLNYNDPAEKIMFVTDLPCPACAKVIVNAGIKQVIYDRDYRLKEGLSVLKYANVSVQRYVRS